MAGTDSRTNSFLLICAGRSSGFFCLSKAFSFFQKYNYCVSGHYLSSCFYLKHTKFRRLGSVSIFMWNLLCWAQSMALVPVFGLPPEDGDRTQSPKRVLFLIKTGRWIMSRNKITVLMHHRHKLLDFI
jgi:hypothetical protein